MNKFIYKNALKEIGVSYLGCTTKNAKMMYSFKNGTETYCMHFAPFNMSGHLVCPKGQHCKDFCLNGSGRNKADILARGEKHSIANLARIKRTKAFFKNKDLFMQTLIHEIEVAEKRAKRNNREFAVRLNGTSDISPLAFKYQGKNILEWFPNIQFYDYSKCFNREKVANDYDNYDVTFSFDGYNWDKCEDVLKRGGKVAVIFDGGKLPKMFKGFKVHDASKYDMRYLDQNGQIMGLHYHNTANDYKNGKYEPPTSKAIIRTDNEYCMF